MGQGSIVVFYGRLLPLLARLRPQRGTRPRRGRRLGSGVFNVDRKCLLGIISSKIPKFKYREVNGHTVMEKDGFADISSSNKER